MQTNSWEAEPDLSSALFSFLYFAPQTLRKCFLLSQRLPCPDEEGMPSFPCTLRGSLKHPCVALSRWCPGSSPTKQNIRFVPGSAACQHIVGLTCKECSPWQAASSWHRCQMISTIIVTISDFSCCFYESLLRQLGYSKALINRAVENLIIGRG